MKTFRVSGATVVGILMLILFISISYSCENSAGTPDSPTENAQAPIEIKTDDNEIQQTSKIVTSLLEDVGRDKSFTELKTEEEQFNHIKDLLASKYKIETDFSYKNLQEAKATILTLDGTPAPSGKSLRTSADDPMAGYSNGERQFVEYATQYTQAASDINQFNSRISELRTGLRTNHHYPYLTYSPPGMDRLTMLDNWLSYYSQYANQWPDNLDTYNPFPPARETPDGRVAGSCRGFWKKLCIAKWAALFGIAGAAATGPGGAFLGAAAGFWVGRCCKCGCTCDVVVCDL